MNQVTDLYASNKLLFGKFYFNHYFRKDSPPFHIQIVKEATNNLDVAMHAPRGSAKSTVETFLDAEHGICLKKERFIVIVQNTYAKAAGTLNNIKFEFRYNDRLKADFGVDMELKDAEGDTIFRHPDGFMTRVLCKGADQLGSIRGERFGAYRPTLILVDDLEDDEMVKNPERRGELEKQFNEVLNYAGESGETRIVVIGTILHDDSLLAKLLNPTQYKRFKKLFFKARNVDENGVKTSLWPEKWTVEKLDQMEADDPVGFAKEMQGDPSSGSLETIRREDFRKWAEVENGITLYNEDGSVKARWRYTDCKAAIGIDLAWEEGKANDWSVFFPGLVTPSNDLLLDSYIYKKGMRPDEWESNAFMLNEKYQKLTGKRVCIGMEKAKLEKVAKWFLQEAQRRRGEWLWLRPIAWGTKDKVERFYFRMANRYANHSVYHKSGLGIYENQIIRLRSVAHDDHADAAGMLPEMLAYAPGKVKTPEPEDKFMEMRKHTPLYRERNKSKYIFGLGTKPSPIKTLFGLQ